MKRVLWVGMWAGMLPAQAVAAGSGVLAPLVDPNVVYLLIVFGLWGVIFELASPGLVLQGALGTASLALGLYLLGYLPVDWWGLGLIGLGVGLMIAEAFFPSYGLLGLGGLGAFTAGSLLLFRHAEMEVSRALVGGTAAVSAAFFLWVVLRVLRLRRQRPVSGREDMIGSTGRVIARGEGHMLIWVHGERWAAVSKQPLRIGQKVRVTGIDGLVLTVEPIGEETS